MAGSQRAPTDQLIKRSNPLFYNNAMLGQCRFLGMYTEKNLLYIIQLKEPWTSSQTICLKPGSAIHRLCD